jgi:type IX secretion system PorP/SprF family membrane protein
MKRFKTPAMKFFTCVTVLLLSLNIGFTQQKPQYTQYILNNYILNPALSGIENYTDVKISHRHQWVGIQDAPVTTYLTINTPIGKQDDRPNATTQFPVSDENSIRGKDMLEQYEVAPSHHGIGMQIINDKIGPFNNVSVMATYAYHMGLSRRTNLSAGIAFGVSKLTLDAQKMYFGSSNPVDPAVYNNNEELGKTRADMNAGLWLYSYNYFVGIAVNQLIPQRLDFSGGLLKANNGKLVPHIFATAGYRIVMSDDVNLIPSVMIKSVGSIPAQLDVNAKLQYMNLLWVGASYRAKYGFAAMVGMSFLNNVSVSYSYDYSTTKINTVSNGTHEILLGFIINHSKETCPKNIW